MYVALKCQQYYTILYFILENNESENRIASCSERYNNNIIIAFPRSGSVQYYSVQCTVLSIL